MKKFWANSEGNMQMIGTVIALFITIIISALVLYTITASVDFDAVDANIGDTVTGAGATGDGANLQNQTPGANASAAILDQAATFYTVAPIIGIVVVAVIILGYVSRIGT